MKLTGNTILITGGTSGIGRALAEAFSRRGNKVIVAGRREHLLEEITTDCPDIVGLPLDLDDPNSIQIFISVIKRRFPDLNVLVNNAGISRSEDYRTDRIDLSIPLSIINTNIVSVLQLTTALLPTLKQQEQATILTTTSGLAFVPRSQYPTYCASKAFLHSWLQSLRTQLRDTSVEVLELAPPYVQTELAGPSQATDPAAMPLDEYISEVMNIIAAPHAPSDEILVRRVKGLRWAEKNVDYEKMYRILNEA